MKKAIALFLLLLPSLAFGKGPCFWNALGMVCSSGSATLSFPASQGVENTYLKNDGNGVLTWETIPGGLNTYYGTCTPTITNIANLDDVSSVDCQYQTIETVTTQSCYLTVNPTTTNTATKVAISLCRSSNIDVVGRVAGVGVTPTISGQSAAVYGEPANDRAIVEWKAVDTSSQPMSVQFTYSSASCDFTAVTTCSECSSFTSGSCAASCQSYVNSNFEPCP